MTQRTVHVAVYDTLVDPEIAYATAHLNNPLYQRHPGRYRVQTAGPTDRPVTTLGGMRIVPDRTVAELTPADSAMLILPGSDLWAAGELDAVAETARRFLAAGVPVAAICGATLGLARVGLLDDRAHTSNAPEFLAQVAGYRGAAHYRDEPAVTDRGLITAAAMHPVEFARQVFLALDVYAPAVLAAWYGLYSTGEAHWFGALTAAAAGAQPNPTDAA